MLPAPSPDSFPRRLRGPSGRGGAHGGTRNKRTPRLRRWGKSMRKRPSFRRRSPRVTAAAAAAAAAQTPGNVHSWPFGGGADAKEPLVWRSLTLSCLPSALFIGVSTYRPTPAQVGFALYNTLQTRIEAERGFRSGTRMHTERGRLLLHAISPPWGTHPRGLLLSIRGFLRRVCPCGGGGVRPQQGRRDT